MSGGSFDKGLDDIRRRIGLAEPIAAGLIENLHDYGVDESIEVATVGVGNGEGDHFDPGDRTDGADRRTAPGARSVSNWRFFRFFCHLFASIRNSTTPGQETSANQLLKP